MQARSQVRRSALACCLLLFLFATVPASGLAAPSTVPGTKPEHARDMISHELIPVLRSVSPQRPALHGTLLSLLSNSSALTLTFHNDSPTVRDLRSDELP